VGRRRHQRERLLLFQSAASITVIIGELDTCLGFRNNLPHKLHRPSAVAALVCRGLRNDSIA
jgi:hypothetical protein